MLMVHDAIIRTLMMIAQLAACLNLRPDIHPVLYLSHSNISATPPPSDIS